MDSAREETRAVPATGVIVDSKHNRPLLLQRRRHRLTIENARKVLAPRETSFWKERSESVQKLPQKKLHKSVVVIIDILPFVKNYISDSGCKFGDTCLFRHTEADRQPSKKCNKRGGQGSVAVLTCPKIQSRRRNLFHGRADILEQTAPSRSPRARGKKIGRERVHRKESINCEPQEHDPCAPKI